MDDIRELIDRFNAREATPSERERLRYLLQTGNHDDIVGEAIQQQLLFELERYDTQKISEADRNAARPAFEQSRNALLEHVRRSGGARSVPPRKRGSLRWPWLAAATFILAAVAALFLYTQKSNTTPVAHVADAPNTKSYHGKQYIRLPDGSTVILNAGSELRYDSTFGLTSRDVTLIGEAFFDIQHDADKPFKVWSGNVYTHVLGTSFNVRAYPDQSDIVVTVARGKVKVCEADRQLAVVMPEQQIAVERATLEVSAVEPVPTTEVLAWKDEFIILDNVTMHEAAQTIGHRFGITVNVTDGIHDCRINAAFLNDETAAHIFTVLSKVLHGDYVQEGDTVTISGSCE